MDKESDIEAARVPAKRSPGWITRIVSPSIPYIAVGLGLLLLHNAWIAVIGYHVGMMVILLLSTRKISFKRLLQTNNWKIPALAAVIGASGGVLLYFLYPALAVPADPNQYLRSIGLTQTTLPFFALYFVLFNALFEEYYWRGYLGSSLKRVTWNDALFAGYHVIVLAGNVTVPWLVVVFMVLTLGAWVWRQTNRLSQGLLPSTVSHLAADATVMLAVVLVLSK